MTNGQVLKTMDDLVQNGATTGQILSATCIALRTESKKERDNDAAQADRLEKDAQRIERLLCEGVDY